MVLSVAAVVLLLRHDDVSLASTRTGVSRPFHSRNTSVVFRRDAHAATLGPSPLPISTQPT
eukprot:5893573-Pleurochrysis_carterae.AAC.1